MLINSHNNHQTRILTILLTLHRLQIKNIIILLHKKHKLKNHRTKTNNLEKINKKICYTLTEVLSTMTTAKSKQEIINKSRRIIRFLIFLRAKKMNLIVTALKKYLNNAIKMIDF